ncbi:MAG: molybdopterin-guanine dinucleotide biosynthesis protein B [Deltaproteobacteria bacterium]|nr:molybdopterin-guanine dinucleotide biosynthesis protein B [Deltaproteobacteria bacterium]MBW2650978.1 molybdopterin-guanine dinucleotide biosynthesis protein B [Deltaproteobacteria bacterium]
MIPVVSIVGKSGSGKTTLIEKVIPELTRKGWRVATIKHSNRGFDIDREGKDSWRHRKAGARMTVMSSPGQIAVIENSEKNPGIEELRDRYIHDVDIIITEGFKGNPYPKIEVFRATLKRDMLCSREDNLIAVASDKQMEIDVPCLDINDMEGIAQLIIDLFLSKVT